jgi:hypothetical protein
LDGRPIAVTSSHDSTVRCEIWPSVARTVNLWSTPDLDVGLYGETGETYGGQGGNVAGSDISADDDTEAGGGQGGYTEPGVSADAMARQADRFKL